MRLSASTPHAKPRCPNLNDASIRKIAAGADGPFYLYDFDGLAARAKALRAALPARFELCFAVKANPSLAVLHALGRAGLGMDVASAGEIAAARAAGVAPGKIVMTGPGKSERDLATAVRARIGGINLEGEAELDRLEALGRRARRRIPVQLRVNPPWALSESTRIIGGRRAAKFGFEPAHARTLLAKRGRWPHLAFGGLQVFNASNVRDAGALVENAGRVIELARSLARSTGMPLRLIDFGGGFGVPYTADETPLDLALLAQGLQELAARSDADQALVRARLLFEPGRWLAAPIGVYICRVLDVKQAGRETIARLYGGIHHLLRPALIGAAHPVRLLGGGMRGRPRARVTLAGPLCTGADLLGEGLELPEPRPGDLVVVENAGAYGYTESMPLFLSHPWAAERGIRGGKVATLRKPPTTSELLAAQRIPAWRGR